jgi:hypothetical protein
VAAVRPDSFLTLTCTWPIRLESSAFHLQTATEELADNAKSLLEDVNYVTLFHGEKYISRGHGKFCLFTSDNLICKCHFYNLL